MCSSCFHGSCVFGEQGNFTCDCQALYSGNQCTYRSGLLYFELPLSIVLLLLCILLGRHLAFKVCDKLQFRDGDHKEFDFPRVFEPRGHNVSIFSWIGVWTGPTVKGLPSPSWPKTLVAIFLIYFMELFVWVQLTAVVFLPTIPWPQASQPFSKVSCTSGNMILVFTVDLYCYFLHV